MTTSIWGNIYPLNSENALIGFCRNDEADIGFITVELFNEEEKPLLYIIGKPLLAREYDIFCVSEHTPFRSKLDNDLGRNTSLYTYNIPKKTLTTLPIWSLIQSSCKNDTPSYLAYSSIKAEKGLKTLFNINPPSNDDPTFLSYEYNQDAKPSKSLNPFARIIESNFFPLARLRRVTWWRRVKDTFFVLNGDMISKKRLGLLDYVFPFPQLFSTLAAWVGINATISGLVSILGFVASTIKTTAAFVFTVILLPVVSIIHLGFKISRLLKNYDDKESVVVSYLYDNQQRTADLSSFAKAHQNLSIKPLARNEKAEYALLSESRKLETNETLVLGIFSDGDPQGIIEMNARNKNGLFSLIQENIFQIDENLEQTDLMGQVLTYIKSA